MTVNKMLLPKTQAVKMLEERDAEIASLRDERDELLSHWQVKHTHDLVMALRDELAKSEDWVRILEKTHKTNNRLFEERRSDAASRDAETIARLKSELDMAYAMRNAAKDKINLQAETVARLREALEPFARLYEETIDDGYHARSIPATDLRRARAALAHLPQEEPI